VTISLLSDKLRGDDLNSLLLLSAKTEFPNLYDDD